MIDEKLLIEAFNNAFEERDIGFGETGTLISMKLDGIIGIIKSQQKVCEWISVKDRLPDKPMIGEDGYIVQMKHVIEPCSAYWNGEYWTDLCNDVLEDVIAWMPLPDPYRGD